jgi:hypothetical protein
MENLLTMCCECKKIKINGNWVGEEYSDYEKIVSDAGNQISDGYCLECLEEFQEKIRLRKLTLAYSL